MYRLFRNFIQQNSNVRNDFGELMCQVRKMGDSSFSFVQHFNHVCSKMEWKVVGDDYDYNQEIATSCYGDMLHDTERNKKFALALEKAISKLHSSGKLAHVLDIGTGTGLLAMLAAKYGADSVVACEAFLPMADCAINIIEQNNFSNKIKIVKKHSTSLTVGDNGDMEHKANILISEVFDTELIGEGAIKTFNHAHKHLLEDDCILIPSLGTVYAQLIESDLAASWNQLRDWETENECLIKIPDEIKKCPGAAAVHDIQLSQFNSNHFKCLTKSVPIFRFDWSCKNPIETYRQSDIILNCKTSGRAQVVFIWWDLFMDVDGEIVLSCAPVWEHPDSKGKSCPEGNPAKYIPWRDHWMQAVYFLTQETTVHENDRVTLRCYHDEFSFWFNINREPTTTIEENTEKSLRPVCNCGVHFMLSRTRIGAMNSSCKRNLYIKYFKQMITSDSYYIVFGDMSLIGLVIAKMGAKKVDILESSSPIRNVIKKISNYNGLNNVTVSENITQICQNAVNSGSDRMSIVSEPFFRNSVLLWDNICFWYMKEDFLRTLKLERPNLKLSNFTISPKSAKMFGCAVQFDDLWKIARRLNYCEGFNMKLFDDLIETAKTRAEAYVEPQPLWEYPGVALTQPFSLFDFNFSDFPTNAVRKDGKLKFLNNCRCDGIAIWMEYHLKDDCYLSTGPTQKIMLNEYITWDMFERQGVHLFRNSRNVSEGDSLEYEVIFTPEDGEFDFHFTVK